MDHGYRQRDFFWGAVVGGTIATLGALLFTTKKGKQVQQYIGDVYKEVEENIKDKFEDSKDKFHELKHKAEDSLEHIGKKVAEKVK